MPQAGRRAVATRADRGSAGSSTAKLGKGRAVSLDPAVGQPYGSLFQLSGDGDSLRKAKRCAHGVRPSLLLRPS